MKPKISITKQLVEIWEVDSPWSHIPTTCVHDGKELKVDFACGNYIIFTEKDLEIKGIAYPNRTTEKFNIGDTKMLDAIENFVVANIIE